MIFMLLSLLLITLVAIFSVQNALAVRITFLFWSFDASLAVVIFLSAMAGALAAAIGCTAFSVRRSLKRRRSSGVPPIDPIGK